MKRSQEKWIVYLLLCWKWKWFILLCLMIGAGHGGYKVITAPLFYEAETSLMVLDSGGAGSNLGMATLMRFQEQSDQELIILNMIQSRRMAEDIAVHFDFEKRYKISRSAATKKATGMVHAILFRKLIVLKTWAEERQLTIDLAYFSFESLQRFNSSLQINSNKFWAQILDPPELSVRVMGRWQQKRAMILETMLGAVIGIVLVICGHEFLAFRKFIEGLRYKD